MTSSQIPSRIAMPCPFGGFGSDNITPIKTVTGTDVNFPDGFPSAYGAPTDTSGKFVTRKEMNAIGNLASNDLFYHKCGGLNTFDADFCAAVGGYPYGAVLDYLAGNQLYSVISLKDNNKVDFTGTTPTPSQSSAGITAGLIDGINWALCNKEMPSQQIINIMSGDNSTASIGNRLHGYIAGVFTSPANGVITGTIDLTYGYKGDGNIINCNWFSNSISNGFVSGGIFIKDVTNSLSGIDLTYSDVESWTCIAGAIQNGTLKSTNNNSINLATSPYAVTDSGLAKFPQYGSLYVSTGRKYAIGTVVSNHVSISTSASISINVISQHYNDSIHYNGFQVKLSVV